MSIKRTLLRYARDIGIDHRLLDFYKTTFDKYEFGDIDPEIRDFELNPGEREGYVLIPVTQGFNRNAYCILAHAFRTRCYEPLVILCDADLSACTAKGVRYFGDDRSACSLCRHFGEALFDAFGIDYIELSDFVTNAPSEWDLSRFESLDPLRYRGVNISGLSKSSARQFLMRRSITSGNIEESELYRRFVRTTLTLVEVTHKIFDQYSIDATIAFHPTYVYGGAYLQVSNSNNTPAYGVQRGYSDQTLLFGRESNRFSMGQFTDPNVVKECLKTPLSSEEREAIDSLIEGRIGGSAARFDMVGDSNRSVKTDNQEVIAMFTNLIWDASLGVEEAAFDGVYDWISATIEMVGGDSDTELVIKTHPAETKRGTNERVGDWVQDHCDPLPDGVQLLPPDTDVSPYELVQDASAVAVYNSTVGLEAAYLGVPVVLGGDTHYRGFGFTYDPDTRQEYKKILTNTAELESTEQSRELARRYAHMLFIRKHMEFPFYQSKSGGGVKRLGAQHGDIVPGNEPFDTICRCILNGEEVMN